MKNNQNKEAQITKFTKKILKATPYIVILLGMILVMYMNSNLVNTDTPWHLKVGEWITSNGEVPKTDIYSYASKNNLMNFIAHEWLFDVTFYLINSFFSIKGMCVITLFFVMLGYGYSSHKSKHPLIALSILAIFTLSGFYKQIWIIPDTLAVVVMLLIALNLINEHRSFNKKLLINSLLSIFLVNWHGGMMTANVIQTLFILICLYASKKQTLKDSLTLLLSTLVFSLINPYGIKIYSYGIMINSTVANYFVDWEPYRFSSLLALSTIMILLVMIIIGYFYKNKKITFDIKLCILFMYVVMLFKYQRTINLFSYGFLFIAPEYVYNFFLYIKENTNNKIASVLNKLHKIKILYITILTISSVLIIATQVLKAPLPNENMEEYIHNNYISVSMEEYIKTNKTLNALELGGYEIYLNLPVYIDGRTDPYLNEYGNKDMFTPYIKSVHDLTLMNELTSEEKINTLLLRKNIVTTQIFYASSDWIVKEETNNTVLFTRKEK